MVARIQHTVWQHYLRAWTDKREKLLCLRNGCIFPTNPRNVMAQRDFYKLEKLTHNKKKFLQEWIDELPILNKEILAIVSHLNQRVEYSDALQLEQDVSFTQNRDAFLRIEALERWHGMVEAKAVPILKALTAQSSTILQSEIDETSFLFFIAHQYLRTRRIRVEFLRSLKDRFPIDVDIEGMICWMTFVASFVVTIDLLADCDRYEIVYLTCPSGLEFLTCDHPVVNISGVLGDRDRSYGERTLYYPIGPNLAVLYVGRHHNLCSKTIDRGVVQTLNDVMAANSLEILVAQSSSELRRYLSREEIGAATDTEILRLLGSVLA